MPRQRAFARLLPALLAGALAIAACADDPVARIRHTNVLLVTVDTLRADHVGAYGHPNPTTPTLDRLAAQGVRFADATVQWPKTWPSMASMLTGTFPATNGVRLRTQAPLARRNETLAELLRAAGYRTAAVVSNLNVGKQFGFDQGFDSFVESWLEKLVRETNRTSFQNHPGAVKRYTDATIVTDQALAWLESVRPQERFFAWLHYMEPHGPYAPPRAHREPFEGRFRPESVPWSRIPAYQRQYHPETGLARGDLAYYKTLYDGEIRYFDSQLARVVEALERRGLFEHTLIVVTADHGESMGEHDYYLEHGKLPYQSTARVPLVMVLPGRLPAGRVVSRRRWV